VKRIIAFALLASFFVVLSPREIWHSHNHVAEKTLAELQIQKTDNSFHSADCFVCDFSLSLFTVHDEFKFDKFSHAVLPRQLKSIPFVETEADLYFSRRGPPKIV
jgi:hypothetical protein|tara:strand:- start:17529 stop:17843 length:315 start_codon:yes stop_codon:yes gene_type:complete